MQRALKVFGDLQRLVNPCKPEKSVKMLVGLHSTRVLCSVCTSISYCRINSVHLYELKIDIHLWFGYKIIISLQKT